MMEGKLIDGNEIASDIRKELKSQIEDFVSRSNVVPSLAALVVGNNPASQIYVNKKIEACQEVGISAKKIEIIEKEDDLKEQINNVNNDPNIHGYILQLPLPMGWNPTNYFRIFNPMKDVDVFHPENVGLLVQGNPRFKPCTPHGIQVMLYRSGIKVSGKKVVIINRSNVVGKPLSSMLIQECDNYANATVTICHDRTPPHILKTITLEADIVIVAVGKPGFLTPDMIMPGTGVVDVGITKIGKKIHGDVHESIKKVAGWYTPVPGGVGPMTVAMLLKNTFLAAKMQVYNTDISMV